MSKGRVALMACLLLAAVAGGARSASAAAPIKPGLLPPPASVPAELRDIETKTEALKLTSFEVKFTTSFDFGRHVPKGLADIFDFGLEGVETVTPPAAALKLTLFGHQMRLRIVGSRHFLFSWALGRRDGGRPWIELGHGPMGKLLGGTGSPSGGKPTTTSFTGLLALLNDGRNLRSLGPSTLDGQAVIGFESEPSQSSLSSGGAGELTAFGSSRHVVKPKPKEKAVLSMYFASNGLPVRTTLVASSGRTSITLAVDFPAANFPDTIPAPPAGHVITEAKLRKLFPPRRPKGTIKIFPVGGKSKQ